MTKHLKLIVRTPEAEIINDSVDSIYFSTELGDMMILPDHASISTYSAYTSLFIRKNEVTNEYVIKNAIFYFSNTKNEAIILCFSVKKREEIDYTSVKKYLELIEQKLSDNKEEDLQGYQYKFLENEKMVLVKEMQDIELRGKS